jgi:hypothetical protein
MDTEYIYNLDIPISCFRFNKDEDIKLLMPELENQGGGVIVCDMRPTYAPDVVSSELSLGALVAKKTNNFPWNSSLTVKAPLANKLRLDSPTGTIGAFTAEESTEVTVNNVNNSDPNDYVTISE